MLTKPAPAGSRRAEILETAANVFAVSGVRASLKDIADACGILPGSIYFHFESKEAIIVELVQRYRDDLNRIAQQAHDQLTGPSLKPLSERIIEFGRAIAACAVRHPAALLITLFEPPTGASEELRQLLRQTPTAIHDAMLDLLRTDSGGDTIRPSVDLALLSDRLCESMMRHGVVDSSLGPQADRLPELRCRILLFGLATEPPQAAELDRSEALQIAKEAVAGWQHEVSGNERLAHLLSVARTEFARRGYEVATTREIAAASGLSVGAVYRLFSSKNEMLNAIMAGYGEHRKAAWNAVIRSSSSPLEKLDALTWLYLKLLESFTDEIRIQFSLVRESPRSVRRIGPLPNLRDIEMLLKAGMKTGELRSYQPIGDYARCVSEALWTPEGVFQAVGVERSHDLARNSVLSGALLR